MISLTTGGRALPSALLANTPYDVAVLIDGREPLFSERVLLFGSTIISQGTGNDFRLQISDPGTYNLHIKALRSDGHGEESVFVLPVSSRRAVAPSLSVRWSRLQTTPGTPVAATIAYADPEGATPSGLAWSLYWNNNLQSTGNSTSIQIAATQHGVYRVVATAKDSTGAVVTADSTMRVSGQYEVLHAIAPPQDENTFQYLGCLYSDTLSAGGSTVSYLPYEIATFVQEAVLLPGTTHVRFVLDAGTGVDDEVIVRTKNGNWALVGPPSGLATDSLVYDYSLDRPYLPAPADKRLAYTLDLWNVHGYTVANTSFRVKVECYYAANPIYEFSRCSYSEFHGGAGSRQRHLIAVVEKLDLDLDAVYRKHRGGADSTIQYTTPIPARIHAVASAQGAPYPQQPVSGFMYTEANLIAAYDPPAGTGLPVLEAKGVYATSGLRPYTFTLSIPREVPIVQRVRRAHGRLAIYMAGGGVNSWTSIRVRIKKNAAPGYVDYTVTPNDVYSPDSSVYEKIGEVSIDVSDYGFDIGGMAILLTIND